MGMSNELRLIESASRFPLNIYKDKKAINYIGKHKILGKHKHQQKKAKDIIECYS